MFFFSGWCGSGLRLGDTLRPALWGSPAIPGGKNGGGESHLRHPEGGMVIRSQPLKMDIYYIYIYIIHIYYIIIHIHIYINKYKRNYYIYIYYIIYIILHIYIFGIWFWIYNTWCGIMWDDLCRLLRPVSWMPDRWQTAICCDGFLACHPRIFPV
jgi:hypothetical protein